MKRIHLISGWLLALIISCQPAQAQQFSQQVDQNAGAVLPLPSGINRIISIDAHNALLVQLEDGEYQMMTVRHIYSGGIARLFGGAIVPTEMFVSPAFNTNVAAGAAFPANFGGFGGNAGGGAGSMGGASNNMGGSGFGR